MWLFQFCCCSPPRFLFLTCAVFEILSSFFLETGDPSPSSCGEYVVNSVLSGSSGQLFVCGQNISLCFEDMLLGR